MNKKMVITAVCLLAMSAMMAQNITGKVVDTKGEPLPFANVMLLNRADSAFVKGAVSGEDGSFTINASCNGGIIKVLSVGYTTVFQDCVGGDLGVVQLSEDSKILGEVVVKSYLPKTILSGDGMLTTVEGSVLEKTSNMEQLLSRIPSVSAKDGQIEVFQTILYGRDGDISRPLQMIDIQYSITIMGGREVSRPCRFFRRRRAVFILLAMPPPSLGRATLVLWCG